MRISVVIPLYNKALHIRRALVSILRQTYANFECIVVDDGSTDRSLDAAAAVRDPRIRIVRQPNAGVSVARNRGIAEARGELVAFLDADDVWMTGFLQSSISMHQRWPDIVASFSNYERTDTRKPVFPTTPEEPVLLDDYCRFCLINKGVGMWTSVVLAKRDCLNACGGFPVGRKIGEDLDTWFRLSALGKVAFSPVVLARYEANQGACSTSAINCDIWHSYGKVVREGMLSRAQVHSAGAYASLMRMLTVEASFRRHDDGHARALFKEIPKGHRRTAYGAACWLACHFTVAPARIWFDIVRRLGLGPAW